MQRACGLVHKDSYVL